MTAPTVSDIRAAVEATDRELGRITDDLTRLAVERAVIVERRAVLAMLSDYETAVADGYGFDRFGARPPGSASDRIRVAVELTDRELSSLDRGAARAVVWHERAVVALLCGSYPAEVRRRWALNEAAPHAVTLRRDGHLEIEAGESPLDEAVRQITGASWNEPNPRRPRDGTHPDDL